ncbi:MAG: aldehyde dehydrogenase EutE [Endomicrobia bacterium]|nr:aldehyde dehydrogenase EutE [Endomicrobiia bacterium]MCX7940480.1 aldehyde dehydrogenase EutE [Endomicrobiia bacterium]MDW8055107.1 aldehyde dehydrogenase EutE [Elusimicrobiota bacterium]
MYITEEELQKLVELVLKRIEEQGTGKKIDSVVPPTKDYRCKSVEEAIERSKIAQKKFNTLKLEQRVKIVDNIRKHAIQNAEYLAKLAAEETKMGRWQHKVKKNILAATKTPGVEDLQPVTAFTGDHGMTLVEYAPFGVIGAVTPSTNPTSTIINNSISILSGGNSVIFCPHPAAKNCSYETMRIINQAIVEVDGPEDLVLTVDPPTVESTQAVLKHSEVKMIVVTGGPAIVKVAMQCGKKTIAAGPGNPPVVVDDTAIFPKCVNDIVEGASFDNGILCTAEKEVILVESVKEKFLYYMRQHPNAYELTTHQMDELAKLAIKEPARRGHPEGVVNRDFVGRNANVIAKAIGLNLPDSITLLWGVVPNDHPFVWTEQLMPVLPVTVVKDIDQAIEFAVEVEGNNHHTFIMHSLNVEHLSRMAKACQGSIFVKNGPSFMGLGFGEGYATLTIATPTGDGLTRARNFCRPLRCVLVDYFRIV